MLKGAKQSIAFYLEPGSAAFVKHSTCPPSAPSAPSTTTHRPSSYTCLYPRAISDTLPLCLYFCSHRISPHNHWGPKRKSPRLSKPQIYSLPRVAEAPVMSYQVQPKSSMLRRRQSTSERLTLHLWYAMHLNDSALKK